jgi:arabinogalactan endo-1,4-beta-galactosidase
MKMNIIIGIVLLTVTLFSCSPIHKATKDKNGNYHWNTFIMGADLSYVNQIENNGGVFKVNNQPKDAFSIFKQIGTNTVRVRLWHNPTWQLPVTGGKMYSDLFDVEKTMQRAKEQGMAVCLDLHYSDDWADPDKQIIPAAWQNLSLNILKDSVYNYTLNVLNYYKSKNLVPEMIQVGNENTFGMLWPIGKIDSANNNWENFGALVNSGIKAVRDFASTSTIKPKVIIHVAQLQYANWWTSNIIEKGKVTDFDILGISHYYKWSNVNSMQAIGDTVQLLKQKFNKPIVLVETAFPWTNDNADTYGNLFYSTTPIEGYAFTKEDQQRYMQDLIQTLIKNGGNGIMYWEPAWITSPMKDRWGKGSSWENNAYFDFSGNLLPYMNFMKHSYKF